MPHVLIERFVGTFPAWMRLFPWCHPYLRAGTEVWGLHPAGCTCPARARVERDHPQNQAAARSSARSGLVFTRPPNIPSPGHFPLQPLRFRLSSLLRVCALGAARLQSPARLHSPSISQALCLLLPSSPFLLALFSFPKTSCQGKAGQEQKKQRKQLLLCNRCLCERRGNWSTFCQVLAQTRFPSGLKNWHKSTLDGEWEEAKAVIPARQ